MPTDLPPRRSAPAKNARPVASKEGNLAFVVAVIIMLAISAVLLWLQPSDAAPSGAGPAITSR